MVVLIAYSGELVIDWQWCDRDKTASWIQRSYFHVRRAGSRDLTRRPRLPANRGLLNLFKALPKVTTLDEAAARATSALEGGPNKAIKAFLRAHRGLSIEHARRGIDWLLYLQTQDPRELWSFVTPHAWDNDRQRPVTVDSGTGRNETNRLYGTGFSIGVGNGIQKG